MSDKNQTLLDALESRFAKQLLSSNLDLGEITLEVQSDALLDVALALRDEFGFGQLMDLCGIDYMEYGQADWETERSSSGFSRAVSKGIAQEASDSRQRFAVVYHLLSLEKNQRLRLRAYAQSEPPCVASVRDIWIAADWYEREAFDMYGILFEGHPDLRRILTDYGFIGHPFRKDFPLIGEVEMRYDPEQNRVIYEPVSIEMRVNTARVIRPQPAH
ncbi:NADH-quinone oxidoreductase subunit C [Candidatus Venteria ishoeyi]|uniref:NADH-quinone oxidoreductase subunit C n=1 Tax=Candidatus Venteria ishoeyi TaxID=1899563 RepID=UPI0025A67114|nr:NADH-quinone oxidoreductase subunit C [Candidatus Venteria ishoeyi]MDM8546169.1 NADH-quinone oxidoreductase subunit C [Candidatus Venteria ishoeyi]